MRSATKPRGGYVRSLRASRLALAFAAMVVGFALVATARAESPASEKILRARIVETGFVPAARLYRNPDEPFVEPGRAIFESKKLSLNGDISCKNCHLVRFGSADGVPIAAAIYGKGEGPERALSGAKFLPRNTLALWGRGAVGFETFFWDGRVSQTGGRVTSVFGSAAPSNDALITAVHLPSVEIREMLDEDSFVRSHKRESVSLAQKIYSAITQNLRQHEPKAMGDLARAAGVPVDRLEYVHVARAIAAFIRSDFRVRPTRLEGFVEGREKLSRNEIDGGLIFYGRGNCSSCHGGPHFSDFGFHAVPLPQLGFGKNGFGVDYGRFNATLRPDDQYRFRTPPLYNVEKTAPYGHSGSLATLNEAVVAHFDPLRLIDAKSLPALARNDLYRRMTLSRDVALSVGFLADDDIDAVVAFLKTLTFKHPAE